MLIRRALVMGLALHERAGTAWQLAACRQAHDHGHYLHALGLGGGVEWPECMKRW